MGTSARNGRAADRPEAEEAAKLYRIAYDLGIRTADDQAEELSGIRTRAVSYMAFVGSATAFLVTTTLRAIEPDVLFFIFAVVATLCSGWATIQLGLLLSPRLVFGARANPRTVIDQYIENQVPQPSESQLLKELAESLVPMIDKNKAALAKVRTSYLQVIICGGSGLLLWATAIWIYVGVGSGA